MRTKHETMLEHNKRSAILDRLQEKVTAGRPILCAAAADALTAKSLERAGADMILVTNGARYEAGNESVFGLLPYGNANLAVKECGAIVAGAVQHTPLFAGACATDPMCGRSQLLRQFRQLGFTGVVNDPSLGLVDGEFRAHLEKSGMSYSQEVDCIASARQLQLLAIGNVFSTEEARGMMKAGADLIQVHLLSVSGHADIREPIARLQELVAVCKAFREDVLILLQCDVRISCEMMQDILIDCPPLAGFRLRLRRSAFPNETAFIRHLLGYKKLELGRPVSSARIS